MSARRELTVYRYQPIVYFFFCIRNFLKVKEFETEIFANNFFKTIRQFGNCPTKKGKKKVVNIKSSHPYVFHCRNVGLGVCIGVNWLRI